MSNPTDAPYIEPALVAWLDRAFPVPAITPKSLPNEIMFAAGQRDAFTKIHNLFLKQQKQ